ncbi:hypothetical protein VTK73DRAFT_5004 [Phialemonium thermophilum]|uniref:Uncharacterized protein n=1 Tax=Phialemonium thermophilum TaxID=223376 RepID=A0ABR3V5C2_9PEZI
MAALCSENCLNGLVTSTLSNAQCSLADSPVRRRGIVKIQRLLQGKGSDDHGTSAVWPWEDLSRRHSSDELQHLMWEGRPDLAYLTMASARTCAVHSAFLVFVSSSMMGCVCSASWIRPSDPFHRDDAIQPRRRCDLSRPWPFGQCSRHSDSAPDVLASHLMGQQPSGADRIVVSRPCRSATTRRNMRKAPVGWRKRLGSDEMTAPRRDLQRWAGNGRGARKPCRGRLGGHEGTRARHLGLRYGNRAEACGPLPPYEPTRAACVRASRVSTLKLFIRQSSHPLRE